MNTRSKKLVLLHQLSQEGLPVPLKDLLEKLGKGFTERSVRRYLTQMITEGIVERVGERRASRYRVVERPFRENNEGQVQRYCFSKQSQKAIERVSCPIYERRPTAYNEEWLNSYRPNVTFYCPLAIRRELAAAGERLNQHDPAGTYDPDC